MPEVGDEARCAVSALHPKCARRELVKSAPIAAPSLGSARIDILTSVTNDIRTRKRHFSLLDN